MYTEFYKELHKLNHEDEMRSKILMMGVKRILEDKKETGLVKGLFRKKKRIEPKGWQ